MEKHRVKKYIKKELRIILCCFIFGFIIGIVGHMLPNCSKLKPEFCSKKQLGDHLLYLSNTIFLWGYFILLPFRFILWLAKKPHLSQGKGAV